MIDKEEEEKHFSLTLCGCYLLSIVLRAFEAEAKRNVKKFVKVCKKLILKHLWRKCREFWQSRTSEDEGLTTYAPEREILGIISMTSAPPSFAEATAASDLSRSWVKTAAVLRLFFWHFLQPFTYFITFAVYASNLTQAQYVIAIVVLIREIIYFIATLILTFLNASFLLTTPFSDVTFARTRRGAAERLGMAGYYIVAPEKFVWSCLVVNLACRFTRVSSIFVLQGRKSYIRANTALEIGIWTLFICDLVALFGLLTDFQQLPLRLALSFALAAASGIMVITTIIHAQCCMTKVEVGDTIDHDQPDLSNFSSSSSRNQVAFNPKNYNKQYHSVPSSIVATGLPPPPSYHYAMSH
mmetsp:Transcript_13555/g.18085  ORF Transcript_13555/g.18085 Transcript_13555/m.18085 type:complete len:355 (+) Transcript_13555:145-1209(+)